jgi:hypothetical protein
VINNWRLFNFSSIGRDPDPAEPTPIVEYNAIQTILHFFFFGICPYKRDISKQFYIEGWCEDPRAPKKTQVALQVNDQLMEVTLH